MDDLVYIEGNRRCKNLSLKGVPVIEDSTMLVLAITKEIKNKQFKKAAQLCIRNNDLLSKEENTQTLFRLILDIYDDWIET